MDLVSPCWADVVRAIFIRNLRLDAGLTQSQLARRLDMEQVSVSRWERGVIAPSMLSAYRLGHLFGIDGERFL